jgi:di/tricarboxylate transporter
MVLTRCITMEEAHKSIDWKAIFLIAAMMPLGFAMRDSGAAQFLADLVVQSVGQYGNLAILGGLMALTLLINPFIPTVVNAVIMTPIGLATAASLGVSPYPFVMGIAYMVAACFMTPVSHPANLMVMSPGGLSFHRLYKKRSTDCFADSGCLLGVVAAGFPFLTIEKIFFYARVESWRSFRIFHHFIVAFLYPITIYN